MHRAGAGNVEHVAVHIGAEHGLAGDGDDNAVKLQPLARKPVKGWGLIQRVTPS